jgi:hypothetical protein
MTRLMPSLLDLAQVVQPETILRWHRAGFRTYWRWKIAGSGGPAQDQSGAARTNPADGKGKTHSGAHRAFIANCSSSALNSPSRPFPSTCPSAVGDRRRVGGRSCVTMLMSSRALICAWSQR